MLENQWVLVTGATAGIGKAAAHQILKKKCNLILIARRKERLQEISKAWSQEFPDQEIHGFAVDLQDRSALQQLFHQEKPLFQKLSILVNNAGLARGADPVQNAVWEDWDEMLETNLKALLFMTRLLIPILLEKTTAHIVNLGSVSGRWVYPGGAVYCATKFAARAFTEGLRMDLLGKPIRITNVEPGMVETEFSEVRYKDSEKAKQVYQGMTPLQAEDIAETIVWCLERPSHVNIQELVIYPRDQASPYHIHRR